ncbi:hypothetical protein [Pseudomonas sp. FYR_7]|uniref:hypothetical protein n=1 Tax=Pseudomonas sp. FYR_7 TaxID=3367174 RepID=UPI00370C0612
MGSFGKALKYRGNINRILEMHEHGNGPNAIAGTFQDHGIDVTPNQVKAILDSHDALSSKALPKSAVKALTTGAQQAFIPA